MPTEVTRQKIHPGGPARLRRSRCVRRPRVRRATVVSVCESLKARYGDSRLGNPTGTLDDLIYIILSNRTSPAVAMRIYATLKNCFNNWIELLQAEPAEIVPILQPGGLSRIKTKHIQSLLAKILHDFGSCTLEPLAGLDFKRSQAYLESLPGVSTKVAKCVLMYTLEAPVLPVDTHVHRIATRLGWTTRKRADQCHEELEAIVPPSYRRTFHIGCVIHGRLTCTSRAPKCSNCMLKPYCKFSQST